MKRLVLFAALAALVVFTAQCKVNDPPGAGQVYQFAQYQTEVTTQLPLHDILFIASYQFTMPFVTEVSKVFCANYNITPWVFIYEPFVFRPPDAFTAFHNATDNLQLAKEINSSFLQSNPLQQTVTKLYPQAYSLMG